MFSLNFGLIQDTHLRDACQKWWDELPLNPTERMAFDALLAPFVQKLFLNNSPDLLVWSFCEMMYLYFIRQNNWVSHHDIQPLHAKDLCDLNTLPESLLEIGKDAAKKLAVLKLNGGLGTTMGCNGPKSLLQIHERETFLDIVGKQLHELRRQVKHPVPLILLNSFNTSDATLSHLKDTTFLELFQHEVPRIDTETNRPFVCHQDKNLEWYPPGHGDLYISLLTTGLLDTLLAKDISYLFVSNADNLGATVDLRLLGYMHKEQRPFLMEVTEKTMHDIKGGTLVRYQDKISLLERAQVSPEESSTFEDISTFKFFNTNSVWINLRTLKNTLAKGPLHLPVIVNPKQVHGTHVIQLEQALGAAIGAFENAIPVSVSRDRFIPVKTTADLLLLQSDFYTKHRNGQIVRSTSGPMPTLILSPHFSKINDFRNRVVYPPSLRECHYLRLDGAITLLRQVKFEGKVEIHVHPDQQLILEKETLRDCILHIDERGVRHHG